MSSTKTFTFPEEENIMYVFPKGSLTDVPNWCLYLEGLGLGSQIYCTWKGDPVTSSSTRILGLYM